MRIAWYTPFSVQSAIGRFSALVTEQLANMGNEVVIVRSESATRAMRQIEMIQSPLQVVWAQEWGAQPGNSVAEFDLVIYNVGDHFTYHEYCYEHLQHVPGIVILHDYVLHNALNGYCQVKLNSPLTYEAVLEDECGTEVLNTMRERMEFDPKRWWQEEIAQHPVLRWVLKGALGVVVHSKFAEFHLRSRVACPSAIIPLAYDGCEDSVPTTGNAPQERMRLLTVGHVNPNKRVREVIEVLGANDSLRSKFEYRVVGPIEDGPRAEIERAIAAGGPEMRVAITGRVETAELRQEFQQADVIVCLRRPAMEGGSASVIEGLLTGKPVVVSKTGCYAEIPSEFVYMIDVDDEKAQLKQVLNSILGDYTEALRRGAAAKQWAKQWHAKENYSNLFLDFCERILYDRPVLRTVDRIAECLKMWNAPPSHALFERIDLVMGDLFRDGRRAKRIA